MDKYKDNGILLVHGEVLNYCGKVDDMKKEIELYNDIYKENSEIVGLEATLKIYLRFKGQQVTFLLFFIIDRHAVEAFIRNLTKHIIFINAYFYKFELQNTLWVVFAKITFCG